MMMSFTSHSQDKNGNVFIGRVWPGYTAFTDFMNFDTHQYWQDQVSPPASHHQDTLSRTPSMFVLKTLQIAAFLELLPVDGLWIDMNEISNFCNGACSPDSEDGVKNANTVTPEGEWRVKHLGPGRLGSHTRTRLRRSGMRNGPVGFNPTLPPYAINNFDTRSPLNTKTLDMDALHMNGSVLEYNAHNLYGLSEAIATSSALETLKKKRSFVLSRSTFPGSGSHAGHWTGMETSSKVLNFSLHLSLGDNYATFNDLEHSIIGMLNFQLFSIPLVGSDICGFHGMRYLGMES